MTRVSWLIPVRDDPRLADALASIAPELGPDDEVIVVDDGSQTPAQAVPHALPVTWLRQGPEGIVAALNRGLAHARGRWIARMDADDLVLPGRIAAQLPVLEQDDAVVAVAGRVRTDAPQMQDYVAWVNANDPMDERLIESPLIHPASLLRASAVRAVGCYRRGDFPEDYDLFLRLSEHGRLARVDAEVLYWRDGPARLTRTDSRYASPAAMPVKQAFLAPRVQGRRVALVGDGGWAAWLAAAAQPCAVQDAELVLIAVEAAARDDARRELRARRPDLREGRDVWVLA